MQVKATILILYDAVVKQSVTQHSDNTGRQMIKKEFYHLESLPFSICVFLYTV